jgi:hypothetical protein
MENFNLKRFLTEGKLLKENQEVELNEIDLSNMGEVALGVAGGLVGLYYTLKGAGWVNNFLGDAADLIGQSMASKAKIALKNQTKSTIEPILKKFEGDIILQDMYKDLPTVLPNGKNQQERRKGLTNIANYIKAKLTPEEMKYFNDISAMLRTGDLAKKY